MGACSEGNGAGLCVPGMFLPPSFLHKGFWCLWGPMKAARSPRHSPTNALGQCRFGALCQVAWGKGPVQHKASALMGVAAWMGGRRQG